MACYSVAAVISTSVQVGIGPVNKSLWYTKFIFSLVWKPSWNHRLVFKKMNEAYTDDIYAYMHSIDIIICLNAGSRIFSQSIYQWIWHTVIFVRKYCMHNYLKWDPVPFVFMGATVGSKLVLITATNRLWGQLWRGWSLTTNMFY